MKSNNIFLCLLFAMIVCVCDTISADDMYVLRVGVGGVTGTSAIPVNINGNVQFTSQLGTTLSSEWHPFMNVSIGANSIKWHNDSWNSTYQTLWLSSYGGRCMLFTRDSLRLCIKPNGYVGIGTASPAMRLDINGTLRADEFLIDVSSGADYVFEENYRLPALPKVKTFIKENRHLPNVMSAEEMMTEGVDMGESSVTLLRKVEELTLYILQQEEKLTRLKESVNNLKKSHP